jgi:hypothetical protein
MLQKSCKSDGNSKKQNPSRTAAIWKKYLDFPHHSSSAKPDNIIWNKFEETLFRQMSDCSYE